MNVRMATYKGEIARPLSQLKRCKCGRAKECLCDKPKVLRRFVTRGGELVEVEAIVRETR